MQEFATIHEQAIDRAGGEQALQSRLPRPRTTRQIRDLQEAFCLSEMTHRIFQAGLNQKMIDNKWPAFEEVFHQFDIDAARMMNDEYLDQLMQDKRIVRHWGKIHSVRHNAQAIHELNEEHGSFTGYLADWPGEDTVGLWRELQKHFKQLGGTSASYFLRRIRKDTFLLTTDVIRALGRWGAIDFVPKNKTQLNQVQACMNEWHAQSALPYCQISMILARSVD